MINLSTKYNTKDRKNVLNERYKYNNKSNDTKNFYRSNYNNKFLPATKFKNKIKLNFNSINHLYFNKLNFNKLPIIRQLKKSSSVGNFDKNKFGKKSKLTIENGNNQYQKHLINI